MKPTLRALVLLATLGAGCAASIPQVDVETPNALRSVDGSSYVAAVHHDAPPSEQALTLAVKAQAQVGQNATRQEADAPDAVQKLSHGF